MYTLLRSTDISLVYPWQYLDEAESCSMGWLIPSSDGYPEPVVTPFGSSLYVFHGALRVGELAGESEPVTIYNWLPIGPARRFHLWLLRGRATLISLNVLFPSLCCTPRQTYRSG